ncbi:hypothetical protein CBL_11617 [Carabus blaptoides fortunei]
MNAAYIETCLRRRFRDAGHNGVYAAKRLPLRVNSCVIVVNTDLDNQPGTHWCAIVLDRTGFGSYFDSYGRPPHHLSFMLHPGASVSLIKASSLNKVSIDRANSISLNGLSPNAPVFTEGETNIELSIRGNKINVNFQLLDSPTNIPFDGLLGDDFLRTHEAKIDYSNSMINLNSIPFGIPLQQNTPQGSALTITVNPRTETVVPIQLLNPHNIKEGVISAQFINSDDTLLISHAMVKVQNRNQSFTTMQTKILLFFLFLPFVHSTSNLYTNTPYNKSSGIFYNNLGEAKITNSKLTLLGHINVTHLNRALDKAKHFYAKSSNLCTTALKDKRNHNFVSFHCEPTLKLINEQLAEITNKAEILSHITGRVISPRKRKGLVNGVSYALNWLFGTPDADDAKYYSDNYTTNYDACQDF